jgi:hypothetical protein
MIDWITVAYRTLLTTAVASAVLGIMGGCQRQLSPAEQAAVDALHQQSIAPMQQAYPARGDDDAWTNAVERCYQGVVYVIFPQANMTVGSIKYTINSVGVPIVATCGQPPRDQQQAAK